MTLFEVNDVAERIGQAIDDAADITFGAVIDPSLHDTIRVTLIAAGMEELHTVRLPAVRQDTSQAFQQSRRAASAGGINSGINSASPVSQSNIPTAPKFPATHPASQPPLPQPASQNFSNPAQMPPPPPTRPGLQGRQQRSLEDLRGLRSLGRRQEPGRGQKFAANNEDIDLPPFLKRPE